MANERVHFWNELHGLAQGHEKRWLLHQWRKDVWDSLIPPYLLCVLCINDQPISPATKNPTVFPRKVKIAPTTLPTIAGKASTAFPTCLLSASANLSNHFFKTPSSFGGEPPVSPPTPPKVPIIARTTVEIVIEKAVSIENIVIPCTRNKVWILSAKEVFWSRTFSRVCLILATCVFFGIQVA